jgi:hypothetical protein
MTRDHQHSPNLNENAVQNGRNRTPAATDVAGVVREMLAARDQNGPKLTPHLSTRKLVEEGRRF